MLVRRRRRRRRHNHHVESGIRCTMYRLKLNAALLHTNWMINNWAIAFASKYMCTAIAYSCHCTRCTYTHLFDMFLLLLNISKLSNVEIQPKIHRDREKKNCYLNMGTQLECISFASPAFNAKLCTTLRIENVRHVNQFRASAMTRRYCQSSSYYIVAEAENTCFVKRNYGINIHWPLLRYHIFEYAFGVGFFSVAINFIVKYQQTHNHSDSKYKTLRRCWQKWNIHFCNWHLPFQNWFVDSNQPKWPPMNNSSEHCVTAEFHYDRQRAVIIRWILLWPVTISRWNSVEKTMHNIQLLNHFNKKHIVSD